MIALLQRVSEAGVTVEGARIAGIGRGLLVFVGVEQGDGEQQVRRMAERLLRFRVFPDDAGRMNLDVCAAGGELLLVPQFTLAADTDAGHRPSFSRAAAPADASALFEALLSRIQSAGMNAASGQFGADMKVALVNDGPVTFSLHVRPASGQISE